MGLAGSSVAAVPGVALSAVALHIERLTIGAVTGAAAGAGGQRPGGGWGPELVVAYAALTLFASRVGSVIEEHISGLTVENQPGGGPLFTIRGRDARTGQRHGEQDGKSEPHGSAIIAGSRPGRTLSRQPASKSPGKLYFGKEGRIPNAPFEAIPFICTADSGCLFDRRWSYGPRANVAAADTSGELALSKDVDSFTKALSVVEQNFADASNPDKAIYKGAIPGMLRTLDPHSNFFDPEGLPACCARTRGAAIMASA